MLADLLSDARFRLRAIFRRGEVERELDDELRYHLERETEKNTRYGRHAMTGGADAAPRTSQACTTSAVTIPNMPVSDSACGRM